MPAELNHQDLLSAAGNRWGIGFVRLRPDLDLAGSPERTAWRSVVEAHDGRLFVLEKIPTRVYGRKKKIADTLQRLVNHGLKPVVAYRPDVDGEAISLINQGAWHGLWQLSAFVAGIDLSRPAYAMDRWRGDAAAAFLIHLDAIDNRRQVEGRHAPFSIVDYCRDLFATLGDRQPGVAEQYRPFMDHLEAHFFAVHDQLPTGFCHGDFHPLNIIWGDLEIRAVIDWEFCGIKPKIYDLANLLGCLGMEAPESLSGPFAGRLIRRLKKADIFDDASWRALPDMMLAIRFAWLSEWLRKNDRPMLRLEADYMALLLKYRTALLHPEPID